MNRQEMLTISMPLITPGNSNVELDESNYSELKLQLINMGFKEELIDHITLFFYPKSLEEAVILMTKDNGVWQHNFIEDEGNKCLICHQVADHIDLKVPKNNENNYYCSFLDNNEVEGGKTAQLTYDSILQKINNTSVVLINDSKYNSDKEQNCDICMEPIAKDERKAVYLECEHYFCKSCWFDYLDEKIKTGQVKDIKCMDFHCDFILPKKFVMNQIKQNEELVIKYDKFSRIKIVSNNQNMKFCPIPNCDGYGERKNDEKYVTCSEGHNFCFNCMKDWHGKKDCQRIIDKDFDKWKKSKIIKQCPKCRYYTEKNDGCNHMACRSCGSDWCWLCQKICNPNTHYEDGSCAGLQFIEIGCLQHWSCFFFYRLGRFLLIWLFYWVLFIPLYGILYCIDVFSDLYLDCGYSFILYFVGISNFIGLYVCFGIPVTIILSLLFIPSLLYWPLLDSFLGLFSNTTGIERLF